MCAVHDDVKRFIHYFGNSAHTYKYNKCHKIGPLVFSSMFACCSIDR